MISHRPSPGELRVLFIGDSVINGGVLTDQANLMTSIVARDESAKLGRPVVTGNASAASWGPPNQAAWLRRYGLLDADVVVFVLSSHDAADVPTFDYKHGGAPISPQRSPIFATQDLLQRYILPRLWPEASVAPPPATLPAPADVQKCTDAMREMVATARAGRAECVLALHLEASERVGNELPGHGILKSLAAEMGVRVIELGPAFATAVAHGTNPYRDSIHPNDLGQRLMAGHGRAGRSGTSRRSNEARNVSVTPGVLVGSVASRNSSSCRRISPTINKSGFVAYSASNAYRRRRGLGFRDAA